MKEDKKLHTIFGYSLRSVITEANKLNITKENIVQIVSLKDVIYLVYSK